MAQTVKICMLGGCSVSCGGRCIDDNANRMKKVWLLLAYLICNRKRHITQEQYLTLLQGAGGENSADPGGKLKAMFYRVRTMLAPVRGTEAAEWIVRGESGYGWNKEVPVWLDVEEFESLCRRGAVAEDGENRLEIYREALSLYCGDFLPKLSMEPWVMPLNAYYHRMYLDTAEETLSLLLEKGEYTEAAQLCEKAIALEPYSEELYNCYMRALIALERRSDAVRAYEEMSEGLFSSFGVMPSDESRRLYREAMREAAMPAVDGTAIRDHLSEKSDRGGAMQCEYDFFRLVYQMQARSIARSGEVVHIALFSIHGHRGKELPRRSLDLALNNLEELLLSNLRQGDLVSRCSASQVVVMLPQANYENAVMVCQRLEKAFERRYPHSPAKLHFTVQPLEPRENK